MRENSINLRFFAVIIHCVAISTAQGLFSIDRKFYPLSISSHCIFALFNIALAIYVHSNNNQFNSIEIFSRHFPHNWVKSFISSLIARCNSSLESIKDRLYRISNKIMKCGFSSILVLFATIALRCRNEIIFISPRIGSAHFYCSSNLYFLL